MLLLGFAERLLRRPPFLQLRQYRVRRLRSAGLNVSQATQDVFQEQQVTLLVCGSIHPTAPQTPLPTKARPSPATTPQVSKVPRNRPLE